MEENIMTYEEELENTEVEATYIDSEEEESTGSIVGKLVGVALAIGAGIGGAIIIRKMTMTEEQKAAEKQKKLDKKLMKLTRKASKLGVVVVKPEVLEKSDEVECEVLEESN